MIKIIQPKSAEEWEQYYLLRYNVLRKPWNQFPGSEKDDQEETSIHFFAISNNEPAGVCRLQYNTPTEAQLRFMGVYDRFRGQKLGKLLIAEAEKVAREAGRNKMVLQARDNAVKYYESCGYQITEKSFLLWETIQHYKMEKSL